MIIFGTRAVHLNTAILNKTTCESCNQTGTIRMSIFRKHFHLFWIPIFPVGKTGRSECTHCKLVQKPAEMSNALIQKYYELKTIAKGPIWQYLGIFLIIIFGIMANLNDFKLTKTSDIEQQYISAPKEGDIYKIKFGEKRYSTLKVVGVSNDSVTISPNKLEINYSPGLNQIDDAINYSDSLFQLSRIQIQEMFDNRDIMVVVRR